jgi:TonB family protein
MISKKFQVEAGFMPIDVPAIQMEDIPLIKHIKKVVVPVKPTIPVEDPEAELELNVLMEFPSFKGFIIPNPPPPPANLRSIDFYAVEVPPELIGGTKAIIDYIITNNLYPKVAGDAGVSGKAIVTFIVDINGIPQNVEIFQERPADLGFGAAAVKVMQAMRFTPGIQRDKLVNVDMQQAIYSTTR